MNILEIKDVTYNYSNSREKVLSSVNQKFELGQFYAIIGKSGAGKSTLLSLLAGLDKPQKGKILFKNEDIEKTGYTNHRKNNISLVFQNYNLIDYLTPIENVRLVNKKASEDILLKLGLDKSQINRNVMKLSGGQQQMLALCRGLMCDPKIILLDEPSLGLAPVIVDEVFDKIREINEKKGISILLVEQNAYMALEASLRCYVLENGVVKLSGNSTDLAENESVKAAYLGG